MGPGRPPPRRARGGLLLALTAAAAGGPPAAAAEAGAEAPEEIRVTGSRRAVRSAGDALAPLDIISGADFSRQGEGDTNSMLRALVPSYNVGEHPIDDGATLVRPANLRGLAPDQMLVLVNGKRRHRAAVITFFGAGVADGAQGPDVSAIPAIALKQVEVLRDGAAAQYGSNAIAGVLNFVLKDAPAGGAVEAKLGQTYAGDGEQRQLSANLGLPLGDGGFLNLSGDWKEVEPTVRSVQTDGARKLLAAGRDGVRQPYAQIWGQPDIRDDWKGFLNLAAPLSERAEFYAFGNYAERETEGGFYFRNPDDRPGAYRWDAPTGRGGETAKARIVVDLNRRRPGRLPRGLRRQRRGAGLHRGRADPGAGGPPVPRPGRRRGGAGAGAGRRAGAAGPDHGPGHRELLHPQRAAAGRLHAAVRRRAERLRAGGRRARASSRAAWPTTSAWPRGRTRWTSSSATPSAPASARTRRPPSSSAPTSKRRSTSTST